MPLPGTEEWNKEEIERTIAFERKTPAAIDELMPLIASANGEGPQGFAARYIPTDAPFALQWAAELAFASDRVGLGLDICSEIVAWLRPRPPTPMQWALWSIAGALSGQVFTALNPQGARAVWVDVDFNKRALKGRRRRGVSRSAKREVVEISWPTGSADAVALGRKLVPAVLASTRHPGFESLFTSDDQWTLQIAAETALRMTDEFRVATFLSGAEAASFEDGGSQFACP